MYNNKIKSKKNRIFFNSFAKYIIIIFVFLSFSKLPHQDNNLDKGLIKLAYYCNSIKYGGVERVISLIINHISKEKIFSQYLITKSDILEGEYFIPKNIKRIGLIKRSGSLFYFIRKKHIDILIYNFYSIREIRQLNQIETTKIIYYDHSSFLYWIYTKHYNFKDTIYNAYKKCKYVISLIPLESNYLFKIWGINSILMNNPTTFEYDYIIPSDLSSKNIIMIGRHYDPIKRFELGIKSMKSILKEIPMCQMNIVSLPSEESEKLIENLNLENNVRFVGFQMNVEIYLRNSSLLILPSLSECYPMVLSEAKIFGIPSILCGLDYLALSKGGTIIIYDDDPETISQEAIKIMKDKDYRKNMGNEARKSMEKFKNNLIIKKWIKLLISIYKGDEQSYNKLLSENENKIKKEEAEKILNNQLKLLKKRNKFFSEINLDKFKMYSF